MKLYFVECQVVPARLVISQVLLDHLLVERPGVDETLQRLSIVYVFLINGEPLDEPIVADGLLETIVCNLNYRPALP